LGNKTKRKHFNVKKCDIFEINKSTSTNNESFTNKQNRGRKKKTNEGGGGPSSESTGDNDPSNKF